MFLPLLPCLLPSVPLCPLELCNFRDHTRARSPFIFTAKVARSPRGCDGGGDGGGDGVGDGRRILRQNRVLMLLAAKKTMMMMIICMQSCGRTAHGGGKVVPDTNILVRRTMLRPNRAGSVRVDILQSRVIGLPYFDLNHKINP